MPWTSCPARFEDPGPFIPRLGIQPREKVSLVSRHERMMEVHIVLHEGALPTDAERLALSEILRREF